MTMQAIEAYKFLGITITVFAGAGAYFFGLDGRVKLGSPFKTKDEALKAGGIAILKARKKQMGKHCAMSEEKENHIYRLLSADPKIDLSFVRTF